MTRRPGRVRLQPLDHSHPYDAVRTSGSDNVESRKRPGASVGGETQQLCPQQRYVKRPKHPGMVTFDGNLRRLPLQKDREAQIGEELSFAIYTSATDNNMTMDAGVDTRPDSPARADVSNSSDRPTEESSPESSAAHDDVQTSSQVFLEKQASISSVDAYNNEFRNHTMDLTSEILDRVVHLNCSTSMTKSTGAPSQGGAFDIQTLLFTQEARLIYTELVAAEPKWQPILQPELKSELERVRWQNLHNLREALLQRTTKHDWFAATQTTESNGLRRMAARFGASTYNIKFEAEEYVRHLRQVSHNLKQEMLAFVDQARMFMDHFSQALPTHKRVWTSVIEDIHCCVHALIDEEVLSSCIYKWCSSEGLAHLHQWKEFKVSQHHVLDDDLWTRYFQQYSQPPAVSETEIGDRYQGTALPLQSAPLCCMAAWLCFGPRIAADFHEFCRVFKFLAWFGATF